MIECSTAPLSCAVDQTTYRIIDQWFGRVLAEKLLYRPPPGEEDLLDVVGLYSGQPAHIFEERPQPEHGRGRSCSSAQKSEIEAIYQCAPASSAAGSAGG